MESKLGNSSENFPLNRPIEHESWKTMAEHLYSDINQLLIKESKLIRMELSEKIGELKTGVASLVIGASILMVGLLAMVATCIMALDQIMELWLASTIVSGILLISGGIIFLMAKKKLDIQTLMPKQSIETFDEISNTFKERINEFKHH